MLGLVLLPAHNTRLVVPMPMHSLELGHEGLPQCTPVPVVLVVVAQSEK